MGGKAEKIVFKVEVIPSVGGSYATWYMNRIGEQFDVMWGDKWNKNSYVVIEDGVPTKRFIYIKHAKRIEND